MTRPRGNSKRIDQVSETLPERALIALARYKESGLVLQGDSMFAQLIEYNTDAMEAGNAER